MKRIFFYSNKFSNYLKNRQWTDSKIIDYFDIEVQKNLSFLNYSFKTNPILIKDFKLYSAALVDAILNLDSLSQSPSIDDVASVLPAIIYNCFE